MSLFQNSNTSFGHAGMASLHGARPALKRSQTPYSPSTDSKRRRTSPTGAFSRLSLSPTSARPIESRLNCSTSSSSFLPSETNHKSLHDPASNKPIGEIIGMDSNFRFGLNNDSQFPYTPPHQSLPTFSPKEAKMRSTYSAYDIDSNRIFVESLSDGDRSPTPSIQLEDDQTQEPSTLELSPTIAHQLSVYHHNQRDQSANILLNSYRLLSDPCSTNDQQLVLYRRPIWPSLPQNDQSFDQDLQPAHDLDEPQIVEIVDLDQDDNSHVLNSNQDLSCADSMELD